jgi:predicted GNAT family acetyltransferase
MSGSAYDHGVEVRRVDDPAGFLEAAAPLLLEDEARHNLILGLVAGLRDLPTLYPDYRLWLVEDGGAAVGAALRTPPHNLAVARPRAEGALEALAASIDDELPGVVGALPEADAFAGLWSGRTGASARGRVALMIYALEAVRPVTGVPGHSRDATSADRPLLLEWWRAFSIEVGHARPGDDAEIARAVDRRLTADGAGFVLWEHDGPVSFAGFGGRTPNGIRIGPVYTPPSLRGRGYASAVVAALSAQLLSGGRRFCFLYTDASNPASNKIYQRIGYEYVCDSAEIVFDS